LKVLGDPAGQAKVLTFHLDDNYGWDDGLICGGRMTILADPLQASERDGGQPREYYRRYLELIQNGTGCTEAVVFQNQDGLPIGSRYLFDGQSRLAARQGIGSLPDAVVKNLAPLAKRPGPRAQQGVAYLPILPRITLLIVGGGHVGHAVADLAAQVDF